MVQTNGHRQRRRPTPSRARPPAARARTIPRATARVSPLQGSAAISSLRSKRQSKRRDNRDGQRPGGESAVRERMVDSRRVRADRTTARRPAPAAARAPARAPPASAIGRLRWRKATAVAAEEHDERRTTHVARQSARSRASRRRATTARPTPRQTRRIALAVGYARAALQQPRGKEARERDQHRADERAVRERESPRRRSRGPQRQPEHERHAGAELQQQAENADDQSACCRTPAQTIAAPSSAHAADVQRASSPSGIASVAKTTPSARKDSTSRRMSSRRAMHRIAREHEIKRGHGKRAPGHRIFDVADERALQPGGDERRAEHESGVDVAPDLDRAAQRIEHGDRDVEEEEQDQKRFGRREVLRPIARHAPERSDEKREHESQQVERAPCLEPRDAEDADVEQRVIAEQQHVVAGLPLDVRIGARKPPTTASAASEIASCRTARHVDSAEIHSSSTNAATGGPARTDATPRTR